MTSSKPLRCGPTLVITLAGQLVGLLAGAAPAQPAPGPAGRPAAAPAFPAATGLTSRPAGAVPAPAPPAAAAAPTPPVHHRRERITPAMRAIRQANTGALSAPRPNAFIGAALVYDYEVGRLYRIDASPRFLTTIALRPGEHLLSKAAGDTVRWVIGETSQGAGDAAQPLVLIKPVRGGERTNLVLTTDQRTYYLEAVSHDAPIYTSVIAWNYPADQLRETQAAAARAAAVAAARDAPVVEANLSLGQLNFNYKIEHPHQRHGPAWEPARVFDDGSKTYIQFPASLASTAAPPLFLIGPKNQAELVNYRVKGGYYIVDRLFDVAELRLGPAPQLVVRIRRGGAAG